MVKVLVPFRKQQNSVKYTLNVITVIDRSLYFLMLLHIQLSYLFAFMTPKHFQHNCCFSLILFLKMMCTVSKGVT